MKLYDVTQVTSRRIESWTKFCYAACQFGKQRQRPSPGKRISVSKDVQGNLKKDKLFPGQCIPVDHYIYSTKGRRFTSRGKTKDTDMYTGGALFKDIGSNEWKMCFSNISTETLKAKQDFEWKARMLVLSLWSTSLTMVQPSPPSPMLPISPISPSFNVLLELEHMTTMELQRRPSRPSCLLQEL